MKQTNKIMKDENKYSLREVIKLLADFGPEYHKSHITDNAKKFMQQRLSIDHNWKSLGDKFKDILYEANGTGSGADDIIEYLKLHYNKLFNEANK